MNRGDILAKASELTNKDRNSTYGPPEVNLGCAGGLIQLFDAYANKNTDLCKNEHDGHRNAIHHVLNKIGRIATGKPHLDNYLDGTAYFAIAGELSGAGEKKEQNACQEAKSPKTAIVIPANSPEGVFLSKHSFCLENSKTYTHFAGNLYLLSRDEDVWVLCSFPEAKSSS